MRVVNYLLSYNPHAPYLATSLYTLRHHWSGPIQVFAWPDSYEIVSQIAQDLGAVCYKREPSYRGRNDQFLDKIELAQTLYDDTNLYLDADTLIRGNIDELFDLTDQFGFAATQFGSWTTAGGLIKGRIKRLEQFPGIETNLIEAVVNNVWPSVNGGVFGFKSNSPVLPLWYKWSNAARSIFICDECVLHLMMPKFGPLNKMHVSCGGVYNSSPKHAPPELDDDKVKIWHGHGDSFVRWKKSAKGCRMWKKVLDECTERNIGGIKEWIGSCGNKWLGEFFDGCKTDERTTEHPVG